MAKGTAAENHARPSTGASLQAARKAATERYAAIAELIKREAGVRQHYHYRPHGGLALPAHRVVVAPEGITRRQLYVLAHECAHVLLHSSSEGAARAGHVKEHEAEVYAHRTFQRYGLEVPEKSAQWARAYVGQWIMKGKNVGFDICTMAADFAQGKRGANDPLPNVDGHSKDDFSRRLERHTSRALSVVPSDGKDVSRPSHDEISAAVAAFAAKRPEIAEVVPHVAALLPHIISTMPLSPLADILEEGCQQALWANPLTRQSMIDAKNSLFNNLPNACGTCWFFRKSTHYNATWAIGRCKAYEQFAGNVRDHPSQ